MTPDRWHQVKQILAELRELPPDRQKELLDQQCRDDPTLRGEVESLLAHGGQAVDFLEPQPWSPLETEDQRGACVEGRRVGRYTLRRVLGHGAMGVVYEAGQENPRRLVALKIIRGRHYVDDRYVRLFEREVQALARLDHPGIAAIYESGRTDDGEHFFAMELIEGRTLTAYARDHCLSSRDRIALFQQVCDAIFFAHQRGVIHRDLKPANILVAASGHPKVLDFGLARITESDLQAATVQTEMGRIQGTLAYMSPEQAAGDPQRIDLRSDVYSLGVILYELLTDRLPYDVRSTSLPNAIRTIREDAPRRPSTVAKTLRGDLETIVLKALEKEPRRRYATVAALADDLRRYLDSEPVLARPPSTMYSARKFARRHQGLVAGMGLALVILIAGIAGMTVATVRARRAEKEAVRLVAVEHELRRLADEARDQATHEAAKASQVQSFLQGMLAAADPAQRGRPDVTVREVLDSASSRLEIELSDQAEVRAALDATIGAAYRELGLYEPAKRHLRRALEHHMQQYGERHKVVAQSLKELASAHLVGSQYLRAEECARRGLDIVRSIDGEASAGAAELLRELGYALQYQGKLREARRQYEEASAIYRALGDAGAGYLDAEAHMALADRALGNHAEAERRIRDVLDRQRALLPNPSATIGNTLNSLGTILESQGKLEEAEKAHREALAIRTEIYGSGHLILAESLNNLGMVLQGQQRLSDAEEMLRRAVDIRRKWLGGDHPLLAISLNNLALVYSLRNEIGHAEAVLAESLDIKRKRKGEVRPESLAISINLLGKLQLAKGDAAAAEENFREARSLFLGAFGADDARVAVAESGLAQAVAGQQRQAEAMALLDHALPILEKAYGADHERTRPARELLARLKERAGP